MRRQGISAAWNTLELMQAAGKRADKYAVSRLLMKTVGDGGVNPSRVYRCIDIIEKFIEMQPNDVDEVLLNALLDTCCRIKDLRSMETFVKRMRELNVKPSPVTLGILVKAYGQAGDLQKVTQVWEEMADLRSEANAVTYGCMIDACIKCGNLPKAVDIFRALRSEKSGKHRNTVLYTTLIKGFGGERDLAGALELFREMPKEGVPYNAITFNSILDACVKCSDLQTAESILREMMAPDSAFEPDLITFSTVLKGYCYVGNIDKALHMAETIKARGMRCDELVYNTLMDGCVKVGDIAAGIGLFEEMVHSGMKPSAITHSILIRLYLRTGPQNWSEDDAAYAVADLYTHHGIPLPSISERAAKPVQRKFQQHRMRGTRGQQQQQQGSSDAFSGNTAWTNAAANAWQCSGWTMWGDASERQIAQGDCYWEAAAPSSQSFGASCSPSSVVTTPIFNPAAEVLGTASGGPFCFSPVDSPGALQPSTPPQVNQVDPQMTMQMLPQLPFQMPQMMVSQTMPVATCSQASPTMITYT
jgi:pentatricopeptide repeat protein